MRTILLLSAFIFLSFIAAAQWQHTNGPACQPSVVRLFVFDSSLYALTSDGLGMYISTDDGNNWSSISHGLPLDPLYFTGIELSLVKTGSNMVVGTDDGVYWSVDNGANWSECISGLIGGRALALAVNQNYVFAGIDGGGIWRSQDYGQNWVAVNFGISSYEPIYSFAVVGSRIYAACDAGIYYSDNNGTLWYSTSVTDPVYSICVSGQVMLATTNTYGVYRSIDGGNNWTFINSGQIQPGLYGSPLAVNGTRFFSSSDESIIFTDDFGDHWSLIDFGYMNGHGSNCLAAHGSKLFSGLISFGVYRTDINNVRWSPANNGIPFTTVTALSTQWVNIFAGTNGGGLYQSSDAGVQWDNYRNYGLDDYHVHALCQAGPELLVGTDSGVYVTLNGNYSWTRCNYGFTSLHINTFTYQGNSIFAGTDDGVYLTTNEGNNWVKKTNGLSNINTRALLATTGSVFAGMKNGGLFRSDNNGSNWVDVSNGLTNNDVTSLAAAGPAVFAGTANGLFRSTDNGQTWVLKNNGLGSSKIDALMTLNTSLFAGTDKGIYLSADFGETWESINDGLPDTVITSLGMSRTELFAGVLGQNVWTRPLSELLSLEITPNNLLLEQSAASSDTLFIVAGTDWSIKGTLPSWLSMSKTAGTGNDQVIFTSLQDNASNAGRVALFTVESTSGLEKAFSVTQKSAIAGIENTASPSILIYPNPAREMVKVVSRTRVSHVSVYDPEGRMLIEKKVNASTTSIDLSGMPMGLLFIKISGKDGDVYQKIMHE